MTLNELLEILKEHLALCIIIPLLCIGAVGVMGIVTPDSYEADTSIYVLLQTGQSEVTTSSDFSASQMAANDVATIMQSEQVRDQVAEQVGLESLAGYKISVESSLQSRVINISVKGEDPQKCEQVANSLIKVTNSIASSSMDIPGVRSMGKPLVDVAPSIFKSAKGLVLGAFGGFFIAVIVAVLKETLNTTVRSKEEVEELLGLPVVGRIPSVGGRN